MTIEIGSSFTIRTTIKNPVTRELETPADVVVTLINPDDTTLMAYTAMTRESEGVYVYVYTLATDAQIGAYCGNIKSTSDDGYIDIDRFSFVTVGLTCDT